MLSACAAWDRCAAEGGGASRRRRAHRRTSVATRMGYLPLRKSRMTRSRSFCVRSLWRAQPNGRRRRAVQARPWRRVLLSVGVGAAWAPQGLARTHRAGRRAASSRTARRPRRAATQTPRQRRPRTGPVACGAAAPVGGPSQCPAPFTQCLANDGRTRGRLGGTRAQAYPRQLFLVRVEHNGHLRNVFVRLADLPDRDTHRVRERIWCARPHSPPTAGLCWLAEARRAQSQVSRPIVRRRTAGQAFDAAVEGRREEQRLAVWPDGVENRAHLRLKAQVEHAVGFVQDQEGRAPKVGGLGAADIWRHTAGRGRRGGRRGTLSPVRLPATGARGGVAMRSRKGQPSSRTGPSS